MGLRGTLKIQHSDAPVIPVLERQRQEDCKFKAIMGYKAIPCLKKLKQSWVPVLTPIILATQEAEIGRITA
jgi:hypothetical protein